VTQTLRDGERAIEVVKVQAAEPTLARDKQINDRNHVFTDRRLELYKP
jgi:hypothetical protein